MPCSRLSWIGEWDRIGGGSSQTAFWILITDVAAGVFPGLFRFLGSLIAVSAVSLYVSKKNLPPTTIYKLLKVIFVFEGTLLGGFVAIGYLGYSAVRRKLDPRLYLIHGFALHGCFNLYSNFPVHPCIQA